jgi:hypothetical protein
MTICIVSSVVRYSAPDEPSGYIYVFDPLKGKVLQRCEMIEPPYRQRDPNPRGGYRGSKGISVRDDQIALANASVVFRYDPDWELLGSITHPTCACIHDIWLDKDVLWVTASQTDLLFKFDLTGRVLGYYYARQLTPVNDELGWTPPLALTPDEILDSNLDFRDPGTHAKEIFNRSHLNSVCVLSNGDILLSLGLVLGGSHAKLLRIKSLMVKRGVWPVLLDANRRIRDLLRLKKDLHSDLAFQPVSARSVVVRIAPDGSFALSLVIPDITTPSHSLVETPSGTVIYLHTTQGCVLHFDPQTGEVISLTKVTDGFLRGITLLPDDRYLMGSKNELITFDLSKQRVATRSRISDNPNEAVYDIKVLPTHYALPPASFREHFTMSMGCDPVYYYRGSFASTGEPKR